MPWPSRSSQRLYVRDHGRAGRRCRDRGHWRARGVGGLVTKRCGSGADSARRPKPTSGPGGTGARRGLTGQAPRPHASRHLPQGPGGESASPSRPRARRPQGPRGEGASPARPGARRPRQDPGRRPDRPWGATAGRGDRVAEGPLSTGRQRAAGRGRGWTRRSSRAHRRLVYIDGLLLRRRELNEHFQALARLAPLTFDEVFSWCLTRNTVWGPHERARVLRRFVAADPDDRWSRAALAETLRQTGRRDEAAGVLSVLPESDPDARPSRPDRP